MTEQQKQALTRIADAAVESERITGCPAELAAAQCVLETGWLSAAPANNCFGIKSYTGEFGRQLLKTKEWFTDAELHRFLALGDGRTATDDGLPARPNGRKRYTVQDWFATFETLGGCFAKRAAMWDEGPYAKAAGEFKQDGNLEALIRGIAPIYATDPKYAESVLSIARSADLSAALAQRRAA